MFDVTFSNRSDFLFRRSLYTALLLKLVVSSLRLKKRASRKDLDLYYHLYALL